MFMGRPPLPEGVAVRLEDYSASWARGDTAFKIDSVNIDVHEVGRKLLMEYQKERWFMFIRLSQFGATVREWEK